MKTLIRFFILIGCVLLFQFSFAKTYNIANGDVAGLIRAMEEANSSSQDDEILLAPNGLYIVNSAAFVGAEGFWNDGSEGPLAFPLISNRSKLIINGRGATIKKSDQSPLFRLFMTQFAADFELHNLTLENGKNNLGGAAVFISFLGTFLADNCQFINNQTVNDYGGAIKIRSRSKIIIKNTLFLNNQSFQNGGALYNTLSDLEMINCQFRQNKTASSGGGAYVDGGRGDNGQAVFDQCIFDSNESGLAIEGGAGGGLYLYSYNLGKAWVKNCTFKNNYAHGEKGYGGGLDYSSETLISEHSEYPYTNTGNKTYLFLHNSAFYDNHSNYLGGGIIFGRGEGEMVNCTVAYNSAIRTSNTGGTGGGLYLNDFELSITNCTIAYNITKGNAGGIATSEEVPPALKIYNTIIAYNESGNRQKIKNNCLATYQGSNNIEFPDILRSSSLETICTPNILIADPLLGPLQDNGGPTLTMALLPGSPAIDAGGNFPMALATDQRGSVRVGKPDIGAFELNLEQDFIINQVVLMNADDDSEIKPLSEIDVIDLSQLTTQNFSFRADPRLTPGSIKFELSGPINHSQTENAALYAIFGNNGDDFHGRVFPEGLYQLKVTPYTGKNTSGQAGPSLVFGFRVVNQSHLQQVVALGLIDANTDQVIKYLTDGCEVNLDEIPENNLSIRVLTLPETVGSVGMQLNGPLNINRTENQSPYALFGDLPRWNYQGQFFPAGAYTFSATPYSKTNLTGIPGLGSNIAFTVSGSNNPFFRLELSTDGNGTAQALPNQTDFYTPTEITLVANQASGYAFSNWTQANGAVISTTNPYTFTISGNQQIRANFSPVSNQPTISGAMLINAANSQDVFLLQNGQVLSLNQLALNNGISLRADAPSQTKSVRFIVNDASGNVLINRVENIRPFSLLGDDQLTYAPWFPIDGTYILTLIPYSAAQASGITGPSYILTFSITESNLPAARASSTKSALEFATTYQLYPNPSDTGVVFLQIPATHSPLARVEIMDYAGKTLQILIPSSLSKVVASENTWQISLNGFAPGTYLLKALHANGEIITFPFIKQ